MQPTIQLTEHFALEEFEIDSPIPVEFVPSFQALCTELLEPIREHFGWPIKITSGYRSPEDNRAAHGVPRSEHIATRAYCAADWRIEWDAYPPEGSMREVFDWIRNNPALRWGQLILEHSPSGRDIIHLSWEAENQRREALEGETANASAYRPWSVAPITLSA